MVLCVCFGLSAQKSYQLVSPNGEIKVSVSVSDKISYNIAYGDETLLENGTMQMQIGKQTPGIGIDRVSAFHAAEHRNEVCLLLGCYAQLVRQLMRSRGRQQADRRIHIHIRLARKGKEKTGGVHVAEKL